MEDGWAGECRSAPFEIALPVSYKHFDREVRVQTVLIEQDRLRLRPKTVCRISPILPQPPFHHSNRITYGVLGDVFACETIQNRNM